MGSNYTDRATVKVNELITKSNITTRQVSVVINYRVFWRILIKLLFWSNCVLHSVRNHSGDQARRYLDAIGSAHIRRGRRGQSRRVRFHIYSRRYDATDVCVRIRRVSNFLSYRRFYFINIKLIDLFSDFSLNIVNLILSAPGVNIHSLDKQGFNCLYYATYYGHIEVLEKLK